MDKKFKTDCLSQVRHFIYFPVLKISNFILLTWSEEIVVAFIVCCGVIVFVILIVESIVEISVEEAETESTEELDTISISSKVEVKGWRDEIGELEVGRLVELCTIIIEDVIVDWVEIKFVLEYMLLDSVVSEFGP